MKRFILIVITALLSILVWGQKTGSIQGIIYITKLRGYLKGDPSLEIITIKGIGYRFVTV